ncbi:hypothetical protein QBC32DRAFT_35711 [Pseudoneurospora amorphoporcata]|uniref:Uncharacterized protein n=1 Tax=Pseudoneurospora amorphoporcata TaxID=241081 RepID=A0AAN6SE01_9PEZI|nr:hypothetical protein QBC32DRAFT_35711 [Pseudoneurospora amorphoporcata]
MIRPRTNPFITGVSASSSSDGNSPSNNNNSSPSSPPSINTSDSGNSGNNRSSSYFNSYRGSYYSDDNNRNRNSSDSDNSNDSTQRNAADLPRPDEAHLPAPYGKTPASTFPLTAQARARARLGHTGSTSTLQSATFPLARGSSSTAGTGIRPPGFSLNDVHNNNNTHNDAADEYEPAGEAVVPPVASPPPYVSHRQDRFLETDQAASATCDPNSPQCPPPAYGVAPPISFLGNSAARDTRTPSIASYRTARSLRSLRGARSINAIDEMIDLERGNPPQTERSEWIESGKVGFITTFVVLVVILCGVWWMFED